jgi:cyanate permease
MLIFNRSYMILWVNFGLIIGAFYAVSTVLPLLLEKYNYSSNDGGFLGFILTVVGIAGAIGVGILCDKTVRQPPSRSRCSPLRTDVF